MIDERPRITYPCPDLGTLLFVPVCVSCGRFVTADETVRLKMIEGDCVEPLTPNATCRRCGRTAMLWEGFL